MADEQITRMVKQSQDLMSELVWRAPQDELAEMAELSDETPQRFIHLITKQWSIVCSGKPIVAMAPSNLAGNIKVGALSLGVRPEMLFVTTRARRSSCARCIHIFNEDMKYARSEMGKACKAMGILGSFGGVVALVVFVIIWLI